jgi:hypothetical protein
MPAAARSETTGRLLLRFVSFQTVRSIAVRNPQSRPAPRQCQSWTMAAVIRPALDRYSGTSQVSKGRAAGKPGRRNRIAYPLPRKHLSPASVPRVLSRPAADRAAGLLFSRCMGCRKATHTRQTCWRGQTATESPRLAPVSLSISSNRGEPPVPRPSFSPKAG